MLREIFEYFLTPCPRSVKAMGFLYEASGIQGRYRRCRDYWAEHIAKTRATILNGVERCNKHRKAVILGAGLLHDIPLDELSAKFREVILVDVVHPLASRWRTRRYRNVRRVSSDITNTIDAAYRVAWDADQLLPHSEPTLFLDDDEVDFTASVNLLSQLPCMPMSYLTRQHTHSDQAIDDFARDLIRAHIKYLDRLPGAVTLVTDIERLKYDLMHRIVEIRDLLFGEKLRKSGAEWEWKLAPAPEADRKYSYFRRVVGIANWK
jgi:hypothetical protein